MLAASHTINRASGIQPIKPSSPPANAKSPAKTATRSGAHGEPYIQLAGKRMYYVAENPEFGDHTLGLYATTPGVSLYSFTFGNNCENKFAHK